MNVQKATFTLMQNTISVQLVHAAIIVKEEDSQYKGEMLLLEILVHLCTSPIMPGWPLRP